MTKKIVDTYGRLHEEILNVYTLYYKYDENLPKKIIVDDLKTSSVTGDNLNLFKDNPNLAHSIINITEKIRYIAFQIIGLNS